jgi:hypothetical protein
MIPLDPTAPPTTIGAQPTNAFEVNQRVGTCLKEFVRVQNIINQNQDWLLSADLKAAPYYFTAEQETDIKSAIGSLDAALDGIDMTFINRLLGLV